VLAALALIGKEFFGSAPGGAACGHPLRVLHDFLIWKPPADTLTWRWSFRPCFRFTAFSASATSKITLAAGLRPSSVGGALGIKYTAASVLLANAVLVLLWSPKTQVAKCAALSGGAGVFLLPWLARNFRVVNNPFFPFLVKQLGGPEWNQVLLSRWIYSFCGSKAWATDRLTISCSSREFSCTVARNRFFFDARWNILLLFVSPLSFIFCPGPALSLALALVPDCVCGLGRGCAARPVPAVRLAGLSLLGGGALSRITKFSGKFLGAFMALIILLFSFLLLPLKKMEIRDDLSFITGRTSWEKIPVFAPGPFRFEEDRPAPRAKPADSARLKIFMLWENRGLYLDRPYLADSGFEAVLYQAGIVECGMPEIFEKWLRQNGFSYVYKCLDRPVGPT